MALMFPRVARNFARNGYFPTDEATLERALQALEPSPDKMSIVDPCAGEGIAIAEAAHALGRTKVHAYAVEYDDERAAHASTLVERCLRSDLMDTVISRQSFGLLWLNPPYGDLVRDQAGGSDFKGRARLEKLFYQRSLPLLQYDGILVYIIPQHTLDSELIGWMTRHFTDLSVFAAVDRQFKQIVIFGRRVRQRDVHSAITASQLAAEHYAERNYLVDVGRGAEEPDPLPSSWPYQRYLVPPSAEEPEHFYRTTLEPEQFAAEVHRLRGLWSAADTHLATSQRSWRRPARALSNWHLSLSLAAGAISGVVTSPNGRVLVVKGDTHKEKSLTTEYAEDEDGSVKETRILTDRFVPVIRAWDMTPNSATRGQVLTIR
jgi:hypothetical protein